MNSPSSYLGCYPKRDNIKKEGREERWKRGESIKITSDRTEYPAIVFYKQNMFSGIRQC